MSGSVVPSRAFVPGLALVLATAVVSGISTFVNGFAVVGTSSDAFVTVRNLVVAGLLVPLVFLARRSAGTALPLDRKDWGLLAVVGLVGGAIPFLLFFHGLALASAEGGATTASFVYRTLFLFAGLFAVVFLGERVRWGIVAGAALLLLGSYLLLTTGSAIVTGGALYVLAATALWAGEYTLSKHLLTRRPATTVALGRMGFGALFLTVYLAATAQWQVVGGFGPSTWAWVGVSALLLTVFVGTWYAGLARVDLGIATAVLVLGYPVTWILSVTVRGSPLLLPAALGSAAVALGVLAFLGSAHLREVARWLKAGRAAAAPPTA
jgi:drug/metabolite transporter (DMT)-like permease